MTLTHTLDGSDIVKIPFCFDAAMEGENIMGLIETLINEAGDKGYYPANVDRSQPLMDGDKEISSNKWNNKCLITFVKIK